VLSGYFVHLGIGLFYTHIRELADEHVSGSAIAVLSMASFTGGFTAPIVVGWLIEQTGSFLSSFAFGLSVCGVGLAWLAPDPNCQAVRPTKRACAPSPSRIFSGKA